MNEALTIVETDPIKRGTTRLNSLSDLAVPQGNAQEPTISTPWPFINSSDYNTFTLNRTAITYGYKTYGLVQTVIDMPVDDAFRGGLKIDMQEVDKEDVAKLLLLMERHEDIKRVKQAGKWARLFGGAGLIAVTDQDPTTELDPESLTEETLLQFLAADRWELIMSGFGIQGMEYRDLAGLEYGYNIPSDFNYYGVPLNDSRVKRMIGKEAPSLIRQRLQGWGLSVLEQCMREINTYIKFENLLFELVDEAKIDVYKIEEFNTSLATAEGTSLIQLRMSLANAIKNYKNAIVMDVKDEYEQKTLTFAGLADIFDQFRTSLCAALKIPKTKLFGESASGFGSGEDSLENYNAMIEVEVRDEIKPLLRWVIELRCQQLFGYVPEFTFDFVPLRVLNAVEEEQVNTSKQNRALALFDRDLTTGEETSEILTKEGLLTIQTEVGEGTREPEPKAGFGAEPEPDDGAEKAQTKKENARLMNGLDKLRVMLRRAA